MKFPVYAQLPRRLARWMRDAGFDAIHTLELPSGNSTSDAEINTLSISEQRVVITKDSDFVDSFVLGHQPWKLLLISTGNISNRDLERLVAANLTTIVTGFASFDYIELSRTRIIFHS